MDRTPRSYNAGNVKRDNRQQQQKLIVILICIVIALLLVVFMTIIGTKIVLALAGGFQNANPNDVQYQNVTIDKSQTLYGPLALINDTHEAYTFPSAATDNLANIWEYRAAHTAEGKDAPYKTVNTSVLMDGAALVATHQWLADFYEETGMRDATITSAFRTFEEQQSFSVPAGKSDHHSGYGITLKIVVNSVTYDLASDPSYNWLAENAYKYGLVMRYPEAKAAITGISGYEYYFHFVGYGPAKYMHDNDLCLEEFVAQIKSYSVDKPLEVTDANGQKWLIYYTACQGDVTTVKLPTNFTYTISGDNEGGIITCVSLSKTAVQEQQSADQAAQ